MGRDASSLIPSVTILKGVLLSLLTSPEGLSPGAHSCSPLTASFPGSRYLWLTGLPQIPSPVTHLHSSPGIKVGFGEA